MLLIFTEAWITTALLCTYFGKRYDKDFWKTAFSTVKACILFTLAYELCRRNAIWTFEKGGIFACTEYIATLEFIYYVYHRAVHKVGFVFHRIHHENRIVHPADTFYSHFYDTSATVILFFAPFFVIPLNESEARWILYFYVTGDYLSHSEILFRHHSLHHRIYTGNYGLLLPVFDILFGTYVDHNRIE
jgi:sterol desaturase/sphingolipid hydroxylase (fatty acid hydroxylase superfamily)